MQYVKNTLVEAANIAGDEAGIALATETTIERKIREIRLAIALESVSTKQEILAGYLNLAFFGNRINGIEAASNYYFGVKAKDLTVPQAAMLTAMLRTRFFMRPEGKTACWIVAKICLEINVLRIGALARAREDGLQSPL
jgi:membrane peptidoglycan carboxypeptidase